MQKQDSLSSKTTSSFSPSIDNGLKTHMQKVYLLMTVAMLLTGVVAWTTAKLAVGDDGFTALGAFLFESPVKWALIFAPLALVIFLSAGLNKLSAAATVMLFYGLSVLLGLSMSAIFISFTGVSIIQTFLVTAIAFASLSLYGYTTKRDLSPMGAFLIMGVVGIIMAMILNIFIASSALNMAITVIGLLVFAGLTAFDTQKIKTDYLSHAAMRDEAWMNKAAVWGALGLYLDFLNLFRFLIEIIGVTSSD
jgi:FtsH-binding integral membrane protein